MTIATEHKGAPVCPHCGAQMDRLAAKRLCEQDDPDYERIASTSRRRTSYPWTCGACRQQFAIERHITVTYSTRKI